MRKFLFAALLFASAASLTSCEKDSPTTKPINFDLPYDMIIVNEGNFTKIDGSFSLYFESKDSVANDVFKKVNGRELGDVVQSLKMVDSLGYFVSNNTGVIEVVSLKTFKSKATISNLGNPRYMEAYNGKGYVSEWKSDAIVVIDLASNKVIKSIKVGIDPEGLFISGDKLFVANSSHGNYTNGYKGKDNTISVIDLKTDNVVKTITVGDKPFKFTQDINGNIWVICSGYSEYNNDAANTNAALCKIDPKTYSVTKLDLGTFRATSIATNPAKNKIYYGIGYPSKGICQIDINATEASKTPFIKDEFYGFSVNPTTGVIYAFTTAYDAVSPNKLFKYDATGTLINSSSKNRNTGIYPNGGYFVK